jgi:hypothetical protein
MQLNQLKFEFGTNAAREYLEVLNENHEKLNTPCEVSDPSTKIPTMVLDNVVYGFLETKIL